MTIDVDKLARECGAKWPDPSECELTRAELFMFARRIMEACAKACDAEASIEGIAQKCGAAIRRMMP